MYTNVLKGVNKMVIEVKRPSDDYFEKAILFVRPSCGDMSKEELSRYADKLLCCDEMRKTAAVKRKQRGIKKVAATLVLVSAAALGGLAIGALLL